MRNITTIYPNITDKGVVKTMMKMLLIPTLFFGLASITIADDSTLNRLAPAIKTPEKFFFVGQYSGPYLVESSIFGNQQGKYTLYIDKHGSVKGKAENYTIGWKGSTWGSINKDGDINLILKWSDSTYTVKGTVAKTKKKHLKGTLVQYEGKKPVARIKIDLRQTSLSPK